MKELVKINTSESKASYIEVDHFGSRILLAELYLIVKTPVTKDDVA